MAQVLESSGNNFTRDIRLVRQQAMQVAESATQITVTANQVAEGAEVQLRVLERTVAIADEMTTSMGETTTQLESIATSTEELASSVNESAASIEEVTKNAESLSASINQILAAVETRYRGVFLLSAGLPGFYKTNQPDANPINFAPHIRPPKHVLNGRFDEYFPVRTQVEPMMKLFSEPKELELFEGPHAPPIEVLAPALNRFFDRTLGPVQRQ